MYYVFVHVFFDCALVKYFCLLVASSFIASLFVRGGKYCVRSVGCSIIHSRWEVLQLYTVGCQFFQSFVRGVKYRLLVASSGFLFMAFPAKKRHKVIKPKAKPGIIKQHLLGNFSICLKTMNF